MKKRLALLALVMLVAVCVYASFGALARHALDGKVYSIAQIRALIALHPRVWIGRTVSVRGRLDAAIWVPSPKVARHATQGTVAIGLVVSQVSSGCYTVGAACRAPSIPESGHGGVPLHLVFVSDTPGAAGPVARLVLHPGQDALILDILRHVPLFDRIIPPLQSIKWGSDATYRLQIVRNPSLSCQSLVCDDAVLINAP